MVMAGERIEEACWH